MLPDDVLNHIIREYNLHPSKNKRLLLNLLADEVFKGNHPIPIEKIVPPKGRLKYIIKNNLHLFQMCGICRVENNLIWLADDVINALESYEGSLD